MSKVTLWVILPCLLFCEMINEFSVSQMGEFGLLFVFCSLHIFIGYGVGWLFGKLTHADTELAKLMKACIAFQDTTAIPLVYASVLGNNSITKPDHHFKNKATEIVLIYTVFITVYKWTFAYGMMKPAITPKNTNEIELLESDSRNGTSKVNENSWLWKIKKTLNPPIYATLVSVPLALIPYMKEYVFAGSGAVFKNNLFAAMTSIGACASPIINLMLGSNLSQGYPPEADISWTCLNLIMVGKMVVMPIFGAAMLFPLYWAGVVNRVMVIMVGVTFASPTSLQLLMICVIHKNQVDNISKVYLFMYLICAIPMSVWTILLLVSAYQ
mmetsp:Transcript_5167/g.5130  ORF Transcript_5167/g.5130 Transcript_5167/m.5130 type:complete len:327 (-) Transcript_5167:33-1013(-)|eukprot:CAMPEP_0202948788 /NCGR_PEP_ID=MMETSP1395-20130829/14640_1 /ASSEMBLY_ACC=CAM_ASM_000871 /TAXON_ID=5961 /ORGANISM="Blepharisma japonicum, Strain Stock R1072" /LENGTH=326 /DNA_ID=CAMNT_0049651205 /DNA_START=115 /DNA_END=1092 /DNA_ORIENTATION=+